MKIADTKYIAAYLTLRCNYQCKYCVAKHDDRSNPTRKEMSGSDWIRLFNSIGPHPNQPPATLCGGEPSLHPDFYDIINGVESHIRFNLLTNLSFDVDEFIERVDSSKFDDNYTDNVAYYPIRATYHPAHANRDEIIAKAKKLMMAGYRVVLMGVLHPHYYEDILVTQSVAQSQGIQFQTKEFIGNLDGIIYGSYSYQEGVAGKLSTVDCYRNEMLIDPEGKVFFCHRDLYRNEIAMVEMPETLNYDQTDFTHRHCSVFGSCHPCDMKEKLSSTMAAGHCSSKIVFTAKEPEENDV